MYSISDSEVKMAASISFSSILNEIQLSNLNFKMELSPFSAVITLKKSSITNSNGIPAIPSLPSSVLLQRAQQDNMELSQKIFNLSLELESLKASKVTAEDEFEKRNATIEDLAKRLYLSKVKTEVEENLLLASAQAENIELKKENKMLVNVSKIVNMKLSETVERFTREKLKVEKDHKKEIKAWKKELGSERKMKINLEKKLSRISTQTEKAGLVMSKPESNLTSSLSVSITSVTPSDSQKTLCTICSLPILDYTPKYFLETEINPSCKLCYEKSSSRAWPFLPSVASRPWP